MKELISYLRKALKIKTYKNMASDRTVCPRRVGIQNQGKDDIKRTKKRGTTREKTYGSRSSLTATKPSESA